jgi:aryl-alcohol dehydrogenase-like predicted oxidoreductase
MKYGYVAGIEKPVSRLVQGSMMISSQDLAGSFALLDGIYALGCTAFDLAHVYGGGDTERTFGRWLHERGTRDDVVIITKGAHHNQDRRRVTPYDITADLHDSLARLGVESIDLYLLHRDDPEVPVGLIVEVLNEHKAAGLIDAFGGSNWTHDRIRAANDYAAAHGLTPFVASSPQFSLAEMVEPPWAGCVSIGGPSETAARAFYAETQIALFTWSSLAGGFFTGRYRRDNLEMLTERQDELVKRSYGSELNLERLERARVLAERKGRTLPQIALAYSQNHPLNVFSLVGCRTPGEFADNLSGLETVLSADEISWLECDEPSTGIEENL